MDGCQTFKLLCFLFVSIRLFLLGLISAHKLFFLLFFHFDKNKKKQKRCFCRRGALLLLQKRCFCTGTRGCTQRCFLQPPYKWHARRFAVMLHSTQASGWGIVSSLHVVFETLPYSYVAPLTLVFKVKRPRIKATCTKAHGIKALKKRTGFFF